MQVTDRQNVDKEVSKQLKETNASEEFTDQT